MEANEQFVKYLIKVNTRAMHFIWGQVPKEKKEGDDTEYIVYVKEDLPYLYYSGLVDTERISLEIWEKAFEDCLGEDERYWVTYEKFLSLGFYRYYRRVQDPFDPLKMRTGKWDVEDLWKVYQRSVIPSCSLPPQFIKNVFEQFIRQGKSVEEAYGTQINEIKEQDPDFNEKQRLELHAVMEGGKKYVTIDRDFLTKLKELLDKYPSPRRILETDVYNLRHEELQRQSDIAHQPQKSKFTAGEDIKKKTQTSLKDMLVKASDNTAGGRKPTEKSFSLADLQKKTHRPPTKF